MPIKTPEQVKLSDLVVTYLDDVGGVCRVTSLPVIDGDRVTFKVQQQNKQYIRTYRRNAKIQVISNGCRRMDITTSRALDRRVTKLLAPGSPSRAPESLRPYLDFCELKEVEKSISRLQKRGLIELHRLNNTTLYRAAFGEQWIGKTIVYWPRKLNGVIREIDGDRAYIDFPMYSQWVPISRLNGISDDARSPLYVACKEALPVLPNQMQRLHPWQIQGLMSDRYPEDLIKQVCLDLSQSGELNGKKYPEGEVGFRPVIRESADWIGQPVTKDRRLGWIEAFWDAQGDRPKRPAIRWIDGAISVSSDEKLEYPLKEFVDIIQAVKGEFDNASC